MGLLIGVLIEALRRNCKHRQKGHRSHVSLFMVLICILIPFTVKVAKSYSCLRVNKFHKELVPSTGLKQSQNLELWNSWHPHGKVSFAVIYSGRYIIGCMLPGQMAVQERSTRSSKSHLCKVFLVWCVRSRAEQSLSRGEVAPANVNPSLLALPEEHAQHPLPNLHTRLSIGFLKPFTA